MTVEFGIKDEQKRKQRNRRLKLAAEVN